MKLAKYIIVFLISTNCSQGAFIAARAHSDTNTPQKSQSNELTHAVQSGDTHWKYMTESEYQKYVKEKSRHRDFGKSPIIAQKSGVIMETVYCIAYIIFMTSFLPIIMGIVIYTPSKPRQGLVTMSLSSFFAIGALSVINVIELIVLDKFDIVWILGLFFMYIFFFWTFYHLKKEKSLSLYLEELCK